MTVLAEHFDIIHIGLWKEAISLAAYITKKKRESLNRIAIVSHPLIHPDPFVVRLRQYIKGPLNHLISALGYKSLFHMLQGFDAIIVSTPYEYAFLTSNGLNNVWFVGEGVDMEYIERNKNKIREKAIELRESIGSENIVSFIGFRDKYKGYYDFLISIIILLNKVDRSKISDIKILVLGRSSEKTFKTRDSIEAKLIEDMLVRKNLIKIYNSLPEIDKYGLIEASDIIVLPSYGETIPLVFLEAWALKKPVVGYRIPTVSSVIRFEGDGGILVEPGDKQGLANALITLLNDPYLRDQIALRGYKKVKEFYNLEVVSKRLIEIYKQLL
jgi:glycosyltransferase involved in cell wall biosynthesis